MPKKRIAIDPKRPIPSITNTGLIFVFIIKYKEVKLKAMVSGPLIEAFATA